MKKITFLLALFCMLMASATAQTRVPSSTLLTVDQLNNATENVYNVYQADETFIASAISSWEEIVNTKLFTLSTSRSDLTISNDSTQGKTTNDIHGTFDADNEQYQWAILKHATNGNYYLYNKAANKFLCKDASMSATPTDAVQNLPQTDSTFLLKFDNSHYINMGGSKQLVIDGWSTADAGNKFTITHVANWDPSEDFLRLLGYGVTYRNVTINYNVGENTYLSTTIEVEDGTTLSASDFNHLDATKDYVTVSDWDKQDAITEDCTVNVSCYLSNDCPLVFSESFENAVWQMVNMHSNYSNYVWSVNLSETGQPNIYIDNRWGNYKSTYAPHDYELWAFVGDITGFKIYNKAAGANYVMSKPSDGDNAVSWITPKEGTIYTAHRTATSISNGACILPKGHTYYLNRRGTNIQGWTARDAGSTVRIFAPDAFLLNYTAELPPVGALGSSSYFSDEANASNYHAALAALDENHYDVEAAQTLGTILTAAAEAELIPNEITKYSYYRLYNASSKTFLTSGIDGENNDVLWGGLNMTAAKSTAGTIVKFELQDYGIYKLYTQGLGFGNVTASTQVTLDDESSSFVITNEGNLYAFCDLHSTDNTHNFLHYQADGRIVGWDNGATTTASKWYLVPANELVVELNPEGDHTYASTFLPYDFTIDKESGVRAYMVTHTEGDVAKTMEVADIAAEQGVILVGESAEKTSVRLYLGTAVSDFSDNILGGTTTSLPILEEEKPTLLVLGNGSKGVGFYNPNSTTLKENRAFLYAEDEIGEATNGLRLEFGGEATGIVATETLNNANAPIYDLSGRRVANPVKGIYVKGGKKIYVK